MFASARNSNRYDSNNSISYNENNENSHYNSNSTKYKRPSSAPGGNSRSKTHSPKNSDDGHKLKSQNSAKVLLPRGSSARIGLLQRHKSSESLLSGESLPYNKFIDVNEPKSVQDNALNVMKMIYKEVGQVPQILGHSASDKLQSLRCEPALEVLKKVPWRSFFDGKQHEGKHRHTAAIFAATNYTKNGEDEDKLLILFNSLVSRVEALWACVKLPDADRDFYCNSLCKGPPQNMEHVKEVAKYINVLQTHRLETMEVLKCINEREHCVSKCYDVLNAISRKISRSDRPKSASSIFVDKQPQQSSSNDVGNIDTLWRSELISMLSELQYHTLRVVKQIQHWRRSLWRPKAFVYGSCGNYLLKIQTDMEILSTDLYMTQLRRCNLTPEDLLCIHFSEKGDDSSKQQTTHTGTEVGDETLRELFLSNSNTNRSELHAAAKVVMFERRLMASLQQEQTSLHKQGVFIPTLKLNAVKSTAHATAPTAPTAEEGNAYEDDFQ